jgi:hypothetical protein
MGSSSPWQKEKFWTLNGKNTKEDLGNFAQVFEWTTKDTHYTKNKFKYKRTKHNFILKDLCSKNVGNREIRETQHSGTLGQELSLVNALL